MSLEAKRVLLTAATGGIGRALALELAASGASIALAGRDEARLAQLAQSAREQGAANAVPLAFDLAAPDGHDALVDAAAAKLGGLDVLVNNAGIQHYGALAGQDPRAIADLVAINITAPLLLSRAALRIFEMRCSGHIVNIGSTFGSIGFPDFAAYSARKFALRGLSEALRRELAGSGTSVTYVSPRATNTEMNSVEIRALHAQTGTRVDDPRTVAREIFGAIERRVAERQIGAPERFFGRLNSLLPRMVDRALVKQRRVASASQRTSRKPAD